tara:strand:- start:178 stop:402 length:225 start_codon:yes stop_codon:yes gene_type:complete
MALSDSEKVTLVTNALKEHIPYTGSGSDTRALADLKTAFLKKHLDALVFAHQRTLANADWNATNIETIATETVS